MIKPKPIYYILRMFLILFLPIPGLALDRVEAYIARLDSTVPELLTRYSVPSAAVAVIHNDQIYSRSWGTADLMTGRLVADTTLYNVASISKLVTAWGVMRLVQEGRISLDAPVSRYLNRWRLPASDWNDQVTVRRLLSHTAGLSMPAVPQYGPGEATPTLERMLSGDKNSLYVLNKPGTSYGYSGGGFAVLQLMIEEVTKQPYERYIESHILKPLGMTDSTFNLTSVSNAATPYDTNLMPLPHYRFAANGAAGLYTTIKDLANLARASLPSQKSQRALPLKPDIISLLRQRTPTEKFDPFGYALGYSIVPLPGGGEAFGHSGSNDGWTALLQTIPDTGDALVVMLNRSDAFFVYRDLLCDWVESIKGSKWQGFCNNGSVSWTQNDAAFVDNIFKEVGPADPASAILIATGSGVVYRKAFGSKDLTSRIPVTPDTPFYIASLTKILTATVSLKLVEEGRWQLSHRIGLYLSDAPSYVKDVTIEQLLSHTSGVPDYYSLVDWANYDGMNNLKAISLLQKRSALEFPAGSRYQYSNSGYVLLATAIERLTGQTFQDVVKEKVLKPAGMRNTIVYDEIKKISENAKGYIRQGDRYVLSDYQIVTVNGEQLPYKATTYGAGGVYSTIDDIYALSQSLDRGNILSFPVRQIQIAPHIAMSGQIEIPNTTGSALGLFISRRYNTNILWNTGDMSGHKSVLIRVPSERLTIIIFSSASGREPEEIALQIADQLLDKKTMP